VYPPKIDDALMHALTLAPWPNNLRQLDTSIQRLLVEADGAELLTLAMCTDGLAYLRGHHARVEPLTAEAIAKAVAQSESKKEAAARLGVDRTTLWRLERRFGNV
jgi:transcriptional regulator of acetoin/glycerol metabolism